MFKKLSLFTAIVLSFMLAAVTALFTIFPNADSLEKRYLPSPITTDAQGNTLIDTRHLGKDVRGFAGPTPLTITISTEGKITALQLQDNQETAQYLEDIQAAGFYQNFLGKRVDDVLDQPVDGVSGATMTSVAIAQNVKKALLLYKNGEQDDFKLAQLLPYMGLVVFVVTLALLLTLRRKNQQQAFIFTSSTLFLVALFVLLYQAFGNTCHLTFGKQGNKSEKQIVQHYIAQRQNVKKFTNQQVTSAQIDSIIGFGKMAGTGRDEDPRRFVVVDRPELFDSIIPAEHRNRIFGNARTWIVVCGDRSVADHHGEYNDTYFLVGANAAQNMALAAQSMGLGASVVNFTKHRLNQKIAKVLQLPESILPFCVVAVGYPAVELPALPLKSQKSAIRYNKY